MQPDGSVARLIHEIKNGNEETSRVLWNRYFPQLAGLAREKLAGQNTRMADDEDVAASVLESFVRAAAESRFPDLQDRSDLWRLLSTMTYRKAVDLIRHEQRQKRLVEGESAIAAVGSEAAAHPLEQTAGGDPAPELAAMLAESCQRLLGVLDPDLRAMAVYRLMQYTNGEIAEMCGRSVPTVQRRLQLIRRKWQRELGS